MTDLFDKGDVSSLLRDQIILLLGGSVVRGLYKDLVWLLNTNSLIDRGVRNIADLCETILILHRKGPWNEG